MSVTPGPDMERRAAAGAERRTAPTWLRPSSFWAASWLRGWRLHLGALALYFGVALWLSWPLARDLGAQVLIGGHGIFFFPTTPDPVMFVWNHWWVARALTTEASLFVSDRLYYPEGVSLYLQTVNYATAVPMAPFTLGLGPVAAYNLSTLLGFQLTGYAGFLLARRYVRMVEPSLLAGLLLTAAPYHVAKFDVGQLNFVAGQWLFLAMVALVALGERGSPLRLLAAALALALTALTDWYLAIVAALFACGWAALSSLRAARPLHSLAWFVGCGLLSGLLLAPLLPGLLAAREPHDELVSSGVWGAYIQGYAADGFGLLFPAALHPLWGEAVERFLIAAAPFSIMEGSYYASGWLLAALGGLGAFWYGRRHWPWLALTGLAWLLAVGPTLYLLGYNTGLPMPYRLIQSLPFLETARRPGLFLLIAHAALTVFAALALQRLGAGMRRPWRLALWLGVLALAIFELSPGARRAVPLEVAPVFAQIAAERPGVVVDLPVEGDTTSRSLLNQLVHEQPILRGYVARSPRYPTLEYASLIALLARQRVPVEEDILGDTRTHMVAQQCFYRLRHVVLDRHLLDPRDREVVLAALSGPDGLGAEAWYNDGRHMAYELPLDQASCVPFGLLGAGWYEPERTETRNWRWSSADTELWLINPAEVERSLQLSLTIIAREEGQPLTIWHGERLLAELELSSLQRRYRVALRLPPGMHQLRLTTPTQAEDGTARQLGVAVLAVEVQ